MAKPTGEIRGAKRRRQGRKQRRQAREKKNKHEDLFTDQRSASMKNVLNLSANVASQAAAEATKELKNGRRNRHKMGVKGLEGSSAVRGH